MASRLPRSNRIDRGLDLITESKARNLNKSNLDSGELSRSSIFCDRNSKQAIETVDLSDTDSINESDILAITLKLRKEGILGADNTLEQWLLKITPQITDGKHLSVQELLTGLKRFSKFE